MKKVCRMIIALLAMQSVSQTASEPSLGKPKVRAITGFVRLDVPNFEAQVADALTILRKAEAEFQSRGYEVESLRLTNAAAG